MRRRCTLPKLTNAKDSSVPLYSQIYDVVYSAMKSGQLVTGEPLPGENYLADYFAVSRGTIRNAMRLLEEDGLIIRRQGKISVVAGLDNRVSGFQLYSDPCRDYCVDEISHVDVEYSTSGCGTRMSNVFKIEEESVLIVAEVFYYAGQLLVAVANLIIPAYVLNSHRIDIDDREAVIGYLTSGMYQDIVRASSEITISKKSLLNDHLGKVCDCFAIIEYGIDAKDNVILHSKNYLSADSYRLKLYRHSNMR